ncbi:MAG: hypothetical protein H0X72_16765 [Acidobacteria bacterium]|jgi:hypothetical protein|nr:hypothetical protein [Acidobacteriota bacterium]
MLKYFLIFAVFAFFPVIAQAQDTEDQTRDLWDTAFLQKRPAGKKQVKKKQPVRYKIVGKKNIAVFLHTRNEGFRDRSYNLAIASLKRLG